MLAFLLAIVYLCIISVKAIANIQPREYQKVESTWKKYEPEQTHSRPVTKKEFAEAGFVSGYLEGEKYFCKIRNDEIIWCSYWGTPPNNQDGS